MADNFTIRCPVCGTENRFENGDRGGQIVCRSHGGPIDVPSLAAPPDNANRALAARGAWRLGIVPQAGTPLPVRHSPVSDGISYLVTALRDLVIGLAQTATGVRVIWEYRAGAAISGAPAAHIDGSLRVHTSDGFLHALSPAGKPLWPPVEAGRPLSWASPLVDHEGSTWICAHAGGLVKVEADGKRSRRPYFSNPTKFDCTGVLHDGMLVVGGEDHFVHCIDLSGQSGREKWDHAADRGRTGWYINSAIAVAGGPTFVVASGDQNLYGFAQDGSQQWKTKLAGQVLGSPVVDAQDRIYVGLCRGVTGSAPSGALACFDAKRRQWLWEVATAGAVESTPVVGSNGTIYLGDNTGGIYAVGDTGKLLWQLWTGHHPIRSAGTIVSSAQVVFGDDAGRLFALRCESPGLAAGWPQLLGSRRAAVAPALAEAQLAALGDSCRTVLETSFACLDKPPAVPAEKIHRARQIVETRRPSPRLSTDSTPGTFSPAAAPARVRDEKTLLPSRQLAPIPQSDPVDSTADGNARTDPVKSAPWQSEQIAAVLPAGRLSSVIDFRSGIDLLDVRPRPWRLPRSGRKQEFPLYLTNGGSGDLLLSVVLAGAGATVSPSDVLRIRPGRGKFVVLRLDPDGDEWVLLDFQVRGALPGRRASVRLFRTSVSIDANQETSSIPRSGASSANQ